jgi:CubicO group peptidase (beta-lactamase class C family)
MIAFRITAVLLACALGLSMTHGTASAAALDAKTSSSAWPVPDWATATPDSQGLSDAAVLRVRDWLKEHGSKTGLMVHHGRIVGEWYWDDATPSTQYIVHSTSKSFASTAAGMAIAKGKIKLDTTVGELLPDVSPAEKRDITVRQLLSMTSGVSNNKDFHGMTKRFTYALSEAPMSAPPGTKWDYNNTGLAILSPLLVKATGQELDEYLDELVFKPIGIPKSEWTWDRNEGHALPYSGLHITARSLARFGLLFLREGKWREEQIVPAEWVAEATRPSQDLNRSYGYLWWNNADGKKLKHAPLDAYAALGKYENNMLIVPGLDLIVIRQVGDDAVKDRKLDMSQLWQLVAECAPNPPVVE